MQKWIKNKNPDGLKKIFVKYFPRGCINFKEFKQFCEKSNLS